MGVIEECGMLVDELRDDPAFVDSLSQLRMSLAYALAAAHPNDRKKRYAEFAQRLAAILERLEAQR